MSNFQIHELTEKAINRNSNIIHDTLNNGSYETGKNLAGAVADLASANVAAAYDSATTYAIGRYCLYEGGIYRSIAITTGAFDSTKWTQIVVTGEFRRVVELTSAQYTALSSAEKNNGTLYVITDEETTAADIPYSAGVSVADKLAVISNTLVANTVTYYKVGNVVQLNLVGYSVPANTGTYASRHIIGYLPAGYRPIVNAYCPYVSSTISTLMVQYTDGELSIRNSSGNAQDAYASIMFITNG